MTSDKVVKSIVHSFKHNKGKDKHNKRALKTDKYQYEKKVINSEEFIISELEKEFIIVPEKLRQIEKYFIGEYKKGLENEDYSLPMIPSFVTELPTGKELGKYITLDLGGTNYKVCEVVLEKQHQVRVRQKKFIIPMTGRTADGDRLFDFMADSVESFLKESGLSSEEEQNLIFTFSFPVRQTGINSGELYHWSKEFNCANTKGNDVVKMLNDAFKRNKINVRVKALVNGTVGILMSGIYNDPQTNISLVVGEGTNAAYVEKIENIKKWKGPQPKSGKMIINTEWADLDDDKNILPINKFDRLVDSRTNNPGKHIFEKMISGFYLGEIVRLTCLHLIKRNLLFGGKSSPIFDKPNSFEIQYLSRIERDYSNELSDTKLILQDLLLIPYSTPRDRRIVRRIVELVSIRSARLAACGIVSLIHQMNKLDGCSVAVDNFIYEHPHYLDRVRDAIHELLGRDAENVSLISSNGGSSVGASIIASIINK